jgi:hypothetical protein
MGLSDRYYINTLIEEAQDYWALYEPIPLDLAADMMEAGLDVEELERKYRP